MYPYQNGLFQPPMMQTQVIRLNGEAGARTLNLAPNCSALALDENAPIVWLVKTDGAGYKTVTPFAISEYKAPPQIDINDLAGRVQKLEAMIRESHNRSNGAADEAAAATDADAIKWPDAADTPII